MTGCDQEPEKINILVVTRDQSETPSLNPTRVQVGAAMALQTDQAENPVMARVEHHYLTYIGDEEAGMEKVREYLDQHPDIRFIVGDYNSKGTALLAALAEEKQIPHMSFFATDESVFQAHDWSFSYRSRVDHETKESMELVTDYIKANQVAVLVTDLANVAQRWERLEEPLATAGVGVYKNWEVNREDLNFRPYLEELKEYEGELDLVILFLTTQQVDHFMQQAKIAELKQPVLVAGISLALESVAEMVDLPVPVYSFVQSFMLRFQGAEDPAIQTFANNYRVAIGNHRVDSLGPYVYDGFRLIHQLVMEEEPETILNRLQTLDEERLVGRTTFDESGLFQRSDYCKVLIEQGSLKEVVR